MEIPWDTDSEGASSVLTLPYYLTLAFHNRCGNPCSVITRKGSKTFGSKVKDCMEENELGKADIWMDVDIWTAGLVLGHSPV